MIPLLYHRCAGFFVIATMLITSPSYAQKKWLTLKPSSSWNIHYAKDSCSLQRAFGTENEKTVLRFDKFQPGKAMSMMIAGKPVKATRLRAETNIAYGDKSAKQKVEFFSGNFGDLPALVISSAPPLLKQESEAADISDANIWLPKNRFTDEEYDSLQAITSLSVSRHTENNVILETGQFKSPMQALDTCIDELVTGWGIDVGKHKNLMRAVTPKANPGRWVTSNDYPEALLRKGKQAIVYFRLIVDVEGAPESCNIQQSTRPVEFDDAVCSALMRRAEFEPALDDKGEAIKSYFISTVVFRASR